MSELASVKKSITASSFIAKWKKLGVRTRTKSAPASCAAFVSAMTAWVLKPLHPTVMGRSARLPCAATSLVNRMSCAFSSRVRVAASPLVPAKTTIGVGFSSARCCG